jgi:hypothetical protein
MLGAAIGAGEECIFTVERDRADGALDGVVVDFDPAIIEEEAEASPTGQRIIARRSG